MSATILIVDDEENARLNTGDFLASRGYEIAGAATLEEARQCIDREGADIILLDVQLPDGYGPSLLEETAHLLNRPPIIMITAYGDIDMAVEAMKNGAHDFLQKPIRLSRLEKSIQRAEEIVAIRRELAHFRSKQRENLDIVIGKSQAMKVIMDQAQRAANSAVSVLLTGKTGTGKEVLANIIHQIGPRSSKPFIPVNSAAIQNTMLESELFGHEAGAFTSAEKRKIGLMEVADGGILFLDEISSMPLDMQAKLLRAIEERAIRRVGGTKMIKVDVQILAASNRNLELMMEEGDFREDLYYRLKVIDLHLPELKARKQDIPELVGYFLRIHNQQLGLNIEGVDPAVMEALVDYDWPGNIRELKNVLERAVIFCDDRSIQLSHLPPSFISSGK